MNTPESRETLPLERVYGPCECGKMVRESETHHGVGYPGHRLNMAVAVGKVPILDRRHRAERRQSVPVPALDAKAAISRLVCWRGDPHTVLFEESELDAALSAAAPTRPPEREKHGPEGNEGYCRCGAFRDPSCAAPVAPESVVACPICESPFSHDHCSECQARNAMPWTHKPSCSHYRAATEFDTPAARAFFASTAPESVGDADAAWWALMRDLPSNPNMGGEWMTDTVARHRPRIESALSRRGDRAGLREALTEIAFMGSDCPTAMSPESFYRSQLHGAIGTAARALRESGDTPEAGDQKKDYFGTRVCGGTACNWSGPTEDFDTHPHRSW